MTRITETYASAIKKGADNRWRVVIATPGQGSSGFYSEEVLATYGPSAFPAGTKAYFNHNSPENRDVRDMLGVYGAAYWNDVDKVLESELDVFAHWKELVDAVGEHIEVSISTGGTIDESGNIVELSYDRTNSVDIVPVAGLEGSRFKERIEVLAESARLHDSANKPSANVAQENGNKMDEKILDAISKLNDALAPLVSFVNDSKVAATESAQIEADEEAAREAAVTAVEAYDAGVALIDAARAELTASQIESARATAKTGEDVSALIESFKKQNEEVKAQLVEGATLQEGRSVGAAGDSSNYSFEWRSK